MAKHRVGRPVLQPGCFEPGGSEKTLTFSELSHLAYSLDAPPASFHPRRRLGVLFLRVATRQFLRTTGRNGLSPQFKMQGWVEALALTSNTMPFVGFRYGSIQPTNIFYDRAGASLRTPLANALSTLIQCGQHRLYRVVARLPAEFRARSLRVEHHAVAHTFDARRFRAPQHAPA